MKNLFLIAALLCFSTIKTFSQTSLLVKDNTTSVTLANGAVTTQTVGANGLNQFGFSFQNISASTKSYKMTRFYDLRNIIGAGDSSYVSFQFCGQHYAPTTQTSVCSITLTANETYTAAVAELYEASIAGRTDVRWRLYEVNNPSDFTEFTIKYNDFTSVKDLSESITFVSETFPCPAGNNAQITIIASKQINASLIISNSAGSFVSSQNYELSIGKNDLALKTDHLRSGIYFITVSTEDAKILKKLVIEK